MQNPRFNVRMLAPEIGAEILDVDVNKLTDEEFAELRRLWVENLVIFGPPAIRSRGCCCPPIRRTLRRSPRPRSLRPVPCR